MLPLAIVDTMTLGRPIGRARIAGVIRAVPPLPPIPITPDSRPDSSSPRRNATSAWLIALIAPERSPAAKPAPRPSVVG